MGRYRTLPVLGAALLLAFICARVRADGPHWHVPNPDPVDYTEEDEGKPKVAQAANNKVGDYTRNPGNFFLLDQACIDYYEKHAVIKYKQGQDLKFYLLIMQRCAQAMREVDDYLPAPDSFPLWHSEELRQLMLVYARRTWIRSTQLKKPINQKCAEWCVQAFIDSVRFGDKAKKNQLGAKVKQFFDQNKKLQQMLEQMAKEKDPQKKAAIRKEWVRLGRDGLNKSGLSKDLARAFTTFKLVTGDIPMQVDDAEARMMDALSGMGTIVIPYLQKATRHKNIQVRRMAWMMIGMIQKVFQRSETGAPTMSNVLEQLRWIRNKPGTPEAQRAMQVLKKMGPKALRYLIAAAENETLNLKQVALGALAFVTGRHYGSDVAKYQAYLKELEAQKQAEKQKQKAQALAEEQAEKKSALQKALQKKKKAPDNEAEEE